MTIQIIGIFMPAWHPFNHYQVFSIGITPTFCGGVLLWPFYYEMKHGSIRQIFLVW